MENDMIKFCSNCGAKIDKDARFCKSCGRALYDESAFSQEKKSEKRVKFGGTVHNCPCCGDILNSFVTNCPSCGYEVREAKPTSSVKELVTKLESIESRQMLITEEKKSLMKMVFGKDLKNEDEMQEAARRFENQKIQEKVTVIINYPVPNTKEDILEFMILATSNINTKLGIDDDLSKAWIQKMEQVYQRAELTIKNSSDLNPIKNLYSNKKNEIEKKKKKGILMVVGGISAYFALMGLLINPGITIGIMALVILGYFFFRKR